LGWSGFLAVGVGGMLGAWLRWGLGAALNPIFPTLPLGTLTANLVGGFIIGVAIEYFARHASVPPEVRLLVITGFLGALTTFSTFSAEAVALLAREQYGWALAHVGSHLLGSLAATVAGIEVVRWLQA
jgi:CrcB protein